MLRIRRAMAGLLARGSTTDADLPGCPVITSGVVSPLTVAGAATASAFRLAPCSLLIPEGNHHQDARPIVGGRASVRSHHCGDRLEHGRLHKGVTEAVQ